MIVSATLSNGLPLTLTHWPYDSPKSVRSCVGVIGPEVEANWITKSLDSVGMTEWVLARKTRVTAVPWLTGLGHNPAAVRVWVDRYYLPEA